MARLIIGIVIFVVIIVIVVGIMLHTHKNKQSNLIWSSIPTQTGVWSPQAVNDYKCPGSLAEGYCILPNVSAAQAYCSTDPTCMGYFTTASSAWHAGLSDNPDAVQLTSSSVTVPNDGLQGQWFPKPVNLSK